MHSFVNNEDKATFDIVYIPSMMVKNFFMLLKKKMRLIVDLTTAKKGLGAT